MTKPLKIYSMAELANCSNAQSHILGNKILLLEGQLPLPKDRSAASFAFESLVFVVCTAGRLRLNMDSTAIVMREGNLLALMPRQVIQMAESEGFEGKYLFLSKEILSHSLVKMNSFVSIANKLHNKPLNHLGTEQHVFFTSILDLIRQTLHNRNSHKEEMIIHVLQTLFYFVDDLLSEKAESNGKPSRANTICRNFLLLVSDHHKKEHTVKFYAEKLCLSPKHLALTVKNVMGESALKIINDFIILQAKSQLRYTDKTIQEIGYELNFSTQSFFGKYFKQHTGMSPGEYRSLDNQAALQTEAERED
ncbi:helix-turn-helix domain-containing protein [Porphyromonas loveana]|uniref:helix-turn-helix domain-containing protein n=1 Tax=Porphyromonas loveana TaxID=1884669 RepID=UPI0035A11CB4